MPLVAMTAEKNIAGKTNKVTIYFFWGRGCPHCSKEKIFLEKLRQKYPTLVIKDYEVWYNRENASFFARILRTSDIKTVSVPSTVIDGKIFIGFTERIGKGIEDSVIYCIKQGCTDASEIINKISEQGLEEGQKIITLPLFGKIDTSEISLPVFTIIIGGLDSFNPCAFFVLLFLLGLLIHARSKKTMFLIGGIFVFFSGFVYFLFMAAWLNIFLIVGQLAIITTTAGIIALTVAAINIKDFFFFKRGVSLVIPERSKPELYEKMRNLLKSRTISTMITGTIILAITANAYELLCTVGFPMVYTRVLTLHKLTTLQYYLYLILYNVIYVIPLAAIVIIITVTLGARKLTEWQGRKLKLVSGLMMLFLGIILLINPSLLNNVLAAVTLLVVALATSTLIIFLTKKLNPRVTGD